MSTKARHQLQYIPADAAIGFSPWLHRHFRSLTSRTEDSERVRELEPWNGWALGLACGSPAHEEHASQLQRLEENRARDGDGCEAVRGSGGSGGSGK